MAKGYAIHELCTCCDLHPGFDSNGARAAVSQRCTLGVRGRGECLHSALNLLGAVSDTKTVRVRVRTKNNRIHRNARQWVQKGQTYR
jgi:hypothetical protein